MLLERKHGKVDAQPILAASVDEIRPISQIPHGTCPIPHNTQFKSEMCTFLLVCLRILDRWIVGFGRLVYTIHQYKALTHWDRDKMAAIFQTTWLGTVQGNKLLSESMMVSLLMHTCVTRPQWVLNAHEPSDQISNFIWQKCVLMI